MAHSLQYHGALVEVGEVTHILAWQHMWLCESSVGSSFDKPWGLRLRQSSARAIMPWRKADRGCFICSQLRDVTGFLGKVWIGVRSFDHQHERVLKKIRID